MIGCGRQVDDVMGWQPSINACEVDLRRGRSATIVCAASAICLVEMPLRIKPLQGSGQRYNVLKSRG